MNDDQNCWHYLSRGLDIIRDVPWTPQQKYEWLKQFSPQKYIANFGCWPRTSTGKRSQPNECMVEPFGLLWSLNATQVDVVELETQHVIDAKRCLEAVQQAAPECFEDEQVHIIQGDLCDFVLESNSYDLAYSAHVLNNTGHKGLQAMVDCVKVGGIVIVVDHEDIDIAELAGQISSIEKIEEVDLSNSPYDNVHVYRKV